MNDTSDQTPKGRFSASLKFTAAVRRVTRPMRRATAWLPRLRRKDAVGSADVSQRTYSLSWERLVDEQLALLSRPAETAATTELDPKTAAGGRVDGLREAA